MNSTQTTRKTLIAILAATGLAAGAALAQQPGYGPGYGPRAQMGPCQRAQGTGPWAGWGSGDWVQNRLDRMALRLNLSQEQKADLEPILRQRQEMRTTQREAMRQEIAAILTPEQRAQFEQLGPVRGGWMGRGMGYGGPGNPQGPGPAW